MTLSDAAAATPQLDAAAAPLMRDGSAAHPSTPTQVPQQKIDENGGLMEYSVVYTDRAMNHMSAPFQEVMNCEIDPWKLVLHRGGFPHRS